MKTKSTFKIKYLYSWVDIGYENNGVDFFVTEKGEVFFINWKRFNKEITLW